MGGKDKAEASKLTYSSFLPFVYPELIHPLSDMLSVSTSFGASTSHTVL